VRALLARALPLAGAPVHEPLRAPAGWDPDQGSDAGDVSLHQYAAASERDDRKVREALAIGLIAGRLLPARHGDTREFWRIPTSEWRATMGDVVRHLLSNWVPLRSLADFRWFDRVLTIAGFPLSCVPDEWLDDFLALPDDYAHSGTEMELRAVLTGSQEELWQIAYRIALRRDGAANIKRVPPVEGDVRTALLGALSPDVPPVVGNCLERSVGSHCRVPTPIMAARLLAMRPGPMRDAAIVDTCDAVENAGLVEETAIPLSHYRMGIVLRGVEPGDERGVRRRIKAYLKGRILPGTRLGPKVDDVYNLMAQERRMLLAAHEPVPEELKLWLLANRPSVPRDRAFYGMVERIAAKLAAKGLRSRKARSDVIADNFDDTLAEGEANLAAILELEREAARGHEHAGDDPDYHFSYQTGLPGPYGRDTGRTMLVNLRSVKVGHLLSRINGRIGHCYGRSAAPYPLCLGEGMDKHDPLFTQERVLVFDSVEAVDGGPQPGVPSWARAHVAGAMLPPNKMTIPQVEARRAYIVSSGLSSYLRAPVGCFRFVGKRDSQFATWAFAVTGDVLLPVREMVRGAALARATHRCMALTLCRFGTISQMIDDEARGFAVVDLGEGRVEVGFRGIPKLPHEQRLLPRGQKERIYPLDGGTVTAIRQLVDILLRLDGDDPAAPGRLRVAIRGAKMPPECEDDRFIFQSGGRAVVGAGATFCLTAFFGRRMKPHDLRHAGSARQYADGETIAGVARTTGHGQKGRARKYIERGDGRLVGGGRRSIEVRDAIAILGGKPARMAAGGATNPGLTR